MAGKQIYGKLSIQLHISQTPSILRLKFGEFDEI